MKKSIIFITKDALRCESLPIYGNKYWETPNICELAKKGTVFNRHYTAGGSTAMAFTAMALGKYCYETDRKLYNGKENSCNGNTIFDKLYELGYDVNIAWDDSYTSFAQTHFKCEGNNTTIHSLKSIIPCHSPHVTGEFDDLAFNNGVTDTAISLVVSLAKKMASIKNKPVFLWFHLPHVFAGRNSYDSDIDVFDRIVGVFREYFDDSCIYISADHGQMNGHKGKFSYGYNVEENVIRIPLITPRFNGEKEINIPTSNIQLLEIFGLCEFKFRKYVICETAYYVQPKRKIAIIMDSYKLVYTKEEKRFELYDLDWDKQEEHNLYYPEFYDVDREAWFSLNQRFFYPNWEKAFFYKKELINIYNKIWRIGTFFDELTQLLLYKFKLVVANLTRKHKMKRIINIWK